MPAPTNIVITNGGETLTFKPKSATAGKAVFEDRTGGIAVGYDPLVITTEDLPSVRRVKLSVRINHIATASGTDSLGFTPGPKLDRFDEVDIIFKANRRSGLVDRERLIAIVSGLLSNASVLGVVRDEEEIL